MAPATGFTIQPLSEINRSTLIGIEPIENHLAGHIEMATAFRKSSYQFGKFSEAQDFIMVPIQPVELLD